MKFRFEELFMKVKVEVGIMSQTWNGEIELNRYGNFCTLSMDSLKLNTIK